MRRVVVLAAALMLLAAPALASEPAVYRSPYIPEGLVSGETTPTDGTTVMVWTGTRWATDTLVVVPDVSLAAECTTVPRKTPAA